VRLTSSIAIIRGWLFVLAAFALATGASCSGDPGYSMFIENGTGETVVVYELGAYQTGDRGFALQPGETKTTHWFRPRDENDKQQTKVKAVNSAGSLVFCRAYSYERAKDNFHWTIRITQGITECS
jgi:hypothetical protein